MHRLYLVAPQSPKNRAATKAPSSLKFIIDIASLGMPSPLLESQARVLHRDATIFSGDPLHRCQSHGPKSGHTTLLSIYSSVSFSALFCVSRRVLSSSHPIPHLLDAFPSPSCRRWSSLPSLVISFSSLTLLLSGRPEHRNVFLVTSPYQCSSYCRQAPLLHLCRRT